MTKPVGTQGAPRQKFRDKYEEFKIYSRQDPIGYISHMRQTNQLFSKLKNLLEVYINRIKKKETEKQGIMGREDPPKPPKSIFVIKFDEKKNIFITRAYRLHPKEGQLCKVQMGAFVAQGVDSFVGLLHLSSTESPPDCLKRNQGTILRNMANFNFYDSDLKPIPYYSKMLSGLPINIKIYTKLD